MERDPRLRPHAAYAGGRFPGGLPRQRPRGGGCRRTSDEHGRPHAVLLAGTTVVMGLLSIFVPGPRSSTASGYRGDRVMMVLGASLTLGLTRPVSEDMSAVLEALHRAPATGCTRHQPWPVRGSRGSAPSWSAGSLATCTGCAGWPWKTASGWQRRPSAAAHRPQLALSHLSHHSDHPAAGPSLRLTTTKPPARKDNAPKARGTPPPGVTAGPPHTPGHRNNSRRLPITTKTCALRTFRSRCPVVIVGRTPAAIV